MQEDLKIFEWKDNFREDYFIDNPYEETLLALEKSINTASGIIENSEGYLKKFLLFKLYDYMFETNFNKDSLDYIHKICEYCPSIEFLSLVFPLTKNHFTEFKKLLKVC
ncbi:hypothetical protein C1645_833813 [Glomus cerebriforme]|uniref:Uncharacterized protein n=1 Tax=Glomus cerebriforme TaxID=658196 RepID=A0A397SFG7_9GLOM|nr:hypothetical protein C1645_833813 [Glomus cerebriforme]